MEKRILLMGDIHGNIANLRYQMKMKRLDNCIIIQVGDFGIGFLPHEQEMQILEFNNNFLKEYNSILIVIRGNHDDPKYFNGDYIDKFSNIKLLPDYTVMGIGDDNILFVGGAVSVDRTGRLREMQIAASHGLDKRSWWPDEVFVLDEESLKHIKDINIVVTHTAPKHCYPINAGNKYDQIVDDYAENDPDLYKDLDNERELVTKMFKILKDNGNNIKYHYYGHFHRSEITLNGYTSHILLDVNELRLIDTQNHYN